MVDMTDQYNTPLNTYEQQLYNNKFSPGDNWDYDMQGWNKANPDASPHTGAHYPDDFKKPNHPTFSDESIYNGVDGHQGGSWSKDTDGQDVFTAGPTNIQMHGDALQDYFNKHEPGVQLITPDSKQGPQ